MKCEVWLYQSEFDISISLSYSEFCNFERRPIKVVIEKYIGNCGISWLYVTMIKTSKIGYIQMSFKDYDIINPQCDVKI